MLPLQCQRRLAASAGAIKCLAVGCDLRKATKTLDFPGFSGNDLRSIVSRRQQLQETLCGILNTAAADTLSHQKQTVYHTSSSRHFIAAAAAAAARTLPQQRQKLHHNSSRKDSSHSSSKDSTTAAAGSGRVSFAESQSLQCRIAESPMQSGCAVSASSAQSGRVSSAE